MDHKMLPLERVTRFCERIFTERKTPFQIRYWRKREIFLTYPYPAPSGYGTRGEFVGIYTIETPQEWIVDDLLFVMQGERDAS